MAWQYATELCKHLGCHNGPARLKHLSSLTWLEAFTQRCCVCRRAAAFIDGEADVSDAGDWSSDEDAGGDAEDLSGLIDDATQQPGSVQPRRCAPPVATQHFW